jgi:hypothetical protein
MSIEKKETDVIFYYKGKRRILIKSTYKASIGPFHFDRELPVERVVL